MNRIAFLSMDDLTDFVTDDELSILPLNQLGMEVDTISWKAKGIRWEDYKVVIVRSTWDYQKDLPAYLEALREIDSRTLLANPLRIMEWNADKTYLRELENRGGRIVPSLWGSTISGPDAFGKWFDQFESNEIVIKPTVSANADDTFRLKPGSSLMSTVQSTFTNRSFMVQPFLQSIVDEGEYSLFYFHGEYSHAILKTPETGDFRVQEEHGGLIQATQITKRIADAGQRIMDIVGEKPLYARVDLARIADEDFALMEIELIEPALYFRTDDQSAAKFAQAVNELLK